MKNNYKFNQYKRHINKSVSMRTNAIKDYLLSKCKPGGLSKEILMQ